MDYITKKEDGHWKCLLFSNMYFMGELKERELLLCCIPRPIFKLINYLFGDKYFASSGTSCSRCTAVFSILIIPFAFVLALMVVSIVMILIVAFLPVFLITIFPCVIFVKCSKSSDDNVVKIVDSDSRHEEGFPLTEQSKNDAANHHTVVASEPTSKAENGGEDLKCDAV